MADVVRRSRRGGPIGHNRPSMAEPIVTTAISTTRAVSRCERLAALGPAPAWWRVFALRRWLRGYRAVMALDISVSAEMLRSLYPADWVAEMARRPNNALRGLTKPAGGPFVEVVERVQIGADGEPDYDTYSVEVRE